MLKKISILTIVLFSLILSPTFARVDEIENVEPEYNVFQILKNDLFGDRRDAISKVEDHKTYTVKKGDTLYRIALEHNINLDDLYEWNGLEGDLIYPGDVLAVTSDATNLVKLSENHMFNKGVKNNKPNQAKKVTTASLVEPELEGKELTVTATAYTAYCKGCSGTTAYGIDLRSNPNQKVIAVDPRIIPLGTKVWVEGYGVAIAGDTGGAIKGNKIDVFIPSYEEAMQWGVKKIKIKILE